MNEQKKLFIIASKGTLDMAYPPLILGTAAAAMDVDVAIFYLLWVKHNQQENNEFVKGIPCW